LNTNANGNITNRQGLSQTGSYGYDALDRLIQDSITSIPSSSVALGYDANGNRTSIELSEACDNHDTCYSRCSAIKLECDLQLRRDIMKECNKMPAGATRGLCKTISVDYGVAVQTWGDSAFKDAQSKCNCK
jgi:YD repeat-containing protein